jgi:hypothetical protein
VSIVVNRHTFYKVSPSSPLAVLITTPYTTDMSSCSSARGSSARSSPDEDSQATSSHPPDSKSAAEDSPGDVVQLLISKRAVSCDDECSCNTMAFPSLKSFLGERIHRAITSFLGDTIKHWALRVGEDVYELRQRSGVNHYERVDFDRVKHLYEERTIYGTTMVGTRDLKVLGKCMYFSPIRQHSGWTYRNLACSFLLASAYITKYRGYDFVQANCQQFAVWLAGYIPMCDTKEPDPNFRDDLSQILRNIKDYLAQKETVTDLTIKDHIDKVISGLKVVAVLAAAGLAFGPKKLWGGIRWLVTTIPQDALTWIVQGLTELTKKMKPLLVLVAGRSTSAWNALSSPLGLKILAGIVAVVAVCGIAWLAWEGGKKFWRWWNHHGK